MKVFYTGSFTKKGQKGINGFCIDNDKLIDVTSCDEVDNPSYIVINPQNKMLYTTNEGDNIALLHSFHILNDGSLQFVNRFPTQGSWSCHLALSKDGKYLACAGYGDGDVDIFGLGKYGEIESRIFHKRHEGKGTHPERQDAPHVHCVSFSPLNDKLLYVCDLGLDKVICYEISDKVVSQKYSIDIPSGDGPRHIAWNPTNPNIMYVVCEITYRVHTIALDPNGGKIIATTMCMPNDFTDFGGSAAMRVVENKMYITNRIMCEPWGRDNAVCYTLDENGIPQEASRISTAYIPRDMNIIDDYMIVGCQGDNKMQIFSLDENKNPKEIIIEREVSQISCISDAITL